jgi:hypothetical protein
MTRYFFAADYHGVSAEDDVGEEFTTLQEAEDHAAIVAYELGCNDSQTVCVRVLTEGGALLASVVPEDRRRRTSHG